jgi:hypothetical protein
MLVGGSITIPHIRRAMKIWDEELADDTPADTPAENAE